MNRLYLSRFFTGFLWLAFVVTTFLMITSPFAENEARKNRATMDAVDALHSTVQSARVAQRALARDIAIEANPLGAVPACWVMSV